MAEEQKAPPLETWAVVEQMGHVRLAGKLTEETHFGVVLGRLDVPIEDGKWQTIFFGGQSIYKIVPCDEATARQVALGCAPAPISRYELKQLQEERTSTAWREDYRREEEDWEE